MDILGIVIFMVFFVGAAGVIAYLALSKKKDEKEDCADGSCDKPIEPCDDGSCDKPVTPPTEEVVPLSVSISPDNPPEVPADVLCTRSLGAYAIYTGLVTKIEWFDVNLGVYVPVGNGTNYLKNENWLFITHHAIKCRVSNDSGQWAEVTKEVV